MGDFPEGPVVEALHCQCGGMGSIPGWGTNIPQAEEHEEQQQQQKPKKQF